MTRLRISLALLVCLSSASLLSAEGRHDFVDDRDISEEVAQTTADILKYSDADNNGLLSQVEAIKAVAQVNEAMTDRLPGASYLSGGQNTVNRMRLVISQRKLDANNDTTVDPVELEKFVRFAIKQSDRASRTDYSVQWAQTMEEGAKIANRYNYDVAMEIETRRANNYRWQRLGAQQQMKMWQEVKQRKEVRRRLDEIDIARAREAGEREERLRETSPGLLPPEAVQPVEPTPQP